MKEKILMPAVGLVVGGIAYWIQPMEVMEKGSNYPLIVISTGAFLVALFLMLHLKKKLVHISLNISLGVAVAVLLRIIYDGMFEDTFSHTLFPIELTFYGVIAFICALIGSSIGLLFRKIFYRFH